MPDHEPPSRPPVVDCQTHWHPRAYFDHLTRRRGYPRAHRDGDGYVVEMSERTRFPIMPLLLDLDRQLEDAAAAGIDVLVSGTGSFGVEDLPADEAREVAQLINEATADAERAHPGSVVGLARIPIQDADAAIEVLDDATRRLGLRGVALGSNVGGEPIAGPERDPVYAALERAGVPLFLHPTRLADADRLDRYGVEYVLGFMFDTSYAALDLVFSGVLERYPALPIIHPHVGGTVPYLAGRIDFEYRQPWAMDGAISEPPSAQLRRFYTDTVSRTPDALAVARRFYGAERLLFSTDYPYWPMAEELAFVREQLPAEEHDAVLGGNAARLLGLPTPTTRPDP